MKDNIFPAKSDGIRNRYFDDIKRDYINQMESSFLFRYFTKECERKLDETFEEIKNGAKTLEECLLKAPNENVGSKRRRSDLWEELCLNDEGLKRGLITKVDYLVWLIEYLESHPIYYKDKSFYNADKWRELTDLLSAGILSDTARRIADPRDKYTLEQAINELMELIKRERRGKAAGITERLEKAAGCLPGLSENLKKMAVHIRIKYYLQDSGYPLHNTQSSKLPKQRKSDGAMRIFEAFCDGEGGYVFIPRAYYSEGLDGHYDPADRFFYLTDKADKYGQIEQLAKTMNEEILQAYQKDAMANDIEDEGRTQVFIPLVSDAVSGSILFLAGKGNYEELYLNLKDKKIRSEYENSRYGCCFDFLVLDDKDLALGAHNVGSAYHMEPRFHVNAGKTYVDILEDFKWYCTKAERSSREAIMYFNGVRPEGISELFFDYFEPEYEPSAEAAGAFFAVQVSEEERMRGGRKGIL